MKQVIDKSKKGETLSKRHRELIQQLQDEYRKLNEQIRQLNLEVENIKSKANVGPVAHLDSTEYSSDRDYMFIE